MVLAGAAVHELSLAGLLAAIAPARRDLAEKMRLAFEPVFGHWEYCGSTLQRRERQKHPVMSAT
jgi:hypothetical protein